MRRVGRPTRWWNSLGLRIALAVALISALVTVTIGTLVVRQAAVDSRERLRAQAFERLEAAAILYVNQRGVLRFSAEIDPPDLPPDLRVGTRPGSQASLFDGTTMWAAQRLGGESLLVVRQSGARLNAESALLRSIWLRTGAGAVAAATLLGFLVGAWLSRRLRAGARAATAIAQGDEDVRAIQPGRDEVAALTRAVDEMADALKRKLAAEKDFTADVAHELRSPVTALVSATELLPEDELGRLVRNQVARLRRLVEDLLEVSRLESGREQVRLEVLDTAQAARAAVGDDVAVEVVRSAAVLGEQRRIDRILGNLVRNAERHATSSVRVVVDGPSVVVADDGPGFPESLLLDGPRRFSTSGHGSGSGLGLTIALRQAEVLGGRLGFANAPEGGAQATLSLPEAPTSPTGE